MSAYKTIKVSEATYETLSKQGTVIDSFDSVIQRLLKKEKQEAKKEVKV